MKVYVLLDGSGSMATRWEQALESINGYVAGVAKEVPSAAITLVVFRAEFNGTDFKAIRDHQRADGWKPVTSKEISPTGGTPLYDAIGRIVSMAGRNPMERTVLIVETDGQENASRELTREGAKVALDGFRANGWQTVFLGADFDAFAQSASVGVSHAQSLNMAGDAGRRYTYEALAGKTVAYAAAGAAMDWNPIEREKAAGK